MPKILAAIRRKRYLKQRRAYWESVYNQNGLRRVPMPFLETYSEEGEIVPLPPLQCFDTPLLNLLPRQPTPVREPIAWHKIGFQEDGK